MAAEPSEKDKAFIELARKRFKLAEDADNKQRIREKEDLAFYAGDQWPRDILDARKATEASAGMPAVPARPSITINRTRGPVRQILNEERQSDLGVEIVDADDFGDLGHPVSDEEIELREGLVRRIQRHSDAAEARAWAFSRAAIAGRGFYRVNTKKLPGKNGDHEVTVDRIFNQASVSMDPAHEKPDGSDAEWEFIGTEITWDQYELDYGKVGDDPNTVLSDTSADAFRALGDEAPTWFKTVGETRMVRVVEYFYRAGEKIKWAKIDGRQILDETDWPCPFMPIVKVLGEELHPYDGERRSEGIVRPARESNQGFNYMVSRQVESIALAPLPPFMVAEGQIETYEKWYEMANTRTLPYLPYRQRDLEGNQAGMPQRVNAESQIAAIANSVSMFAEAIQTTTMVHGTSLGDADPSVRSGKAASALVQQQRQGTSNFMDNLVRSMHYEAQIENALLPVIYGREGRLTSIVNGAGVRTPVLLHKPMVMSGSPKRPMAVPAMAGQQGAKTYTLTAEATFNIAIKVTKNFDTRREEAHAQIGEIIAADPQQGMSLFGDLYFKYSNDPGHQELQKRAELGLNPAVQATLNGQQPIPPQVKQQMDQAGKLIQELTAHVNQLTQQIQTKQVETQADIQKAQMDNATKLEIAKIAAGAQITIADLKTTVDQAMAQTKVELEQMRTIIDAAHEERLQAHDHAHEAALATMSHVHDHAVIAHEAAVAPEPASTGTSNGND